MRSALDDVAAEFVSQGYAVERSTAASAGSSAGTTSTTSGLEGPLLRVAMDTFHDFQYQVMMVQAPVPTFSGKMARNTDIYYRLEVFTEAGSGGYDLMGLTRQQVINDVLERYEAHLASLTASAPT